MTNTARKSSTKNTFGGLLGQIKTGSPLANPLQMAGDTQIQGTGETNRSNTLTTTLTGRVTHVLANGLLVVEGTKTIEVNSERQLVTVRGLARPTDVGPANQVISDRLAMLEIKVNGRGVVGDAIRRPFFLYRLLLGFLAL